MHKKEITKKAWEIFNSVLDTIEFPSYVTLTKNEDGSCVFLLTLIDELNGAAIFSYKPSIKAVEYWITQSKGVEEAVGKDLAEEFTMIIAQAYVYAFLTNFHVEIAQCFQSFAEIAGLVITQLPAEAIKYLPKVNDIEEKSNNHLKEFLDERRKKFKERIYEQIKDQEEIGKPAKNLIDIFYSDTLREWKEAKKFYKQNKNFKNWGKLISVAFPDLPNDLIVRLDDSDKYFSMPSAIALEHAARFCGFANNTIELRTLQNYLKESRKWLSEKNNEDKEKELHNFFAKVSKEIITIARVSTSMGKEPDFERLPYIYQLMYQQAMNKMTNETNENEQNS